MNFRKEKGGKREIIFTKRRGERQACAYADWRQQSEKDFPPLDLFIFKFIDYKSN